MIADELKWIDLIDDCLDKEPFDLTTCKPQLAKDVNYAKAIQTAWKQEIIENAQTEHQSEVTSFTYQEDNDDDVSASLYGYLIRPKDLSTTTKVPGIILFHTGAGPHDVCLLWKAHSLVTSNVFSSNGGCIVMIADILSDESGWAWSSDRSRYNTERQRVLSSVDDNGARYILRRRIRAAVKAFEQSCPNVDRLGAMGFCLGGHPILELARIKLPEIKAMATFHGVFDSIPPPQEEESSVSNKEENNGNILICNGEKDPFVTEASLNNACDTMKQNNYNVEIMQLQGARHGFTNPAQDYNPNESFEFNKGASELAWGKAVQMFGSLLVDDA